MSGSRAVSSDSERVTKRDALRDSIVTILTTVGGKTALKKRDLVGRGVYEKQEARIYGVWARSNPDRRATAAGQHAGLLNLVPAEKKIN